MYIHVHACSVHVHVHMNTWNYIKGQVHVHVHVHNVFSGEMLGSDVGEKMSSSICEASLSDDAYCKMRSYMYTFISQFRGEREHVTLYM